MRTDHLMPIGELARRAGVATSALRYYERIGLLSPAERVGQQRRYTGSTAERVALIRLCQDAGFTLAEIRRHRAHARRDRAEVRSAGRGRRRRACAQVHRVRARIRLSGGRKCVMEFVFAGPISDALTLQRVLRDQGVHALTVAILFTRVEDADEARRIVESMEGGAA